MNAQKLHISGTGIYSVGVFALSGGLFPSYTSPDVSSSVTLKGVSIASNLQTITFSPSEFQSHIYFS